MIRTDEENLILARSTEYVDDLNAKFYGRFPYPWRPVEFNYLADPDFERVMLNQNLGDWRHETVPARPKIWVAGCGTNQAVYTALKFPAAEVVGSDLSEQSLELSAQSAGELGLTNLSLRRESINHAPYEEEFDYVICTGVIHHNADPAEPLCRLRRALRPAGVLELMVYNRFHRITTTAFQKAVRLLGGSTPAGGFERELGLARRIINCFTAKNTMGAFLEGYRDTPETALADSLLQPVEFSYTVESLRELADGCGLEFLLPTVNVYDRSTRSLNWNMAFADEVLQTTYDALPDAARWQVTNLLLLDHSPMLWFYMQRADSPRPRRAERQVCEEFLETRFARAETEQRGFLQNASGHYEPAARAATYPPAHADAQARRVVEACDGRATMRQILEGLGAGLGFHAVNQARIELTTSVAPYLRAVASEPEPARQAEALKEAGLRKLRTARRKAVEN